jgi:hypothetical protein
MKTSTQKNPAVIIGNVINLFLAVGGAAAVVYGIALAVVKSHAFGF